MINKIFELYDIDNDIVRAVAPIELKIEPLFKSIDSIKSYNHYKVLKAMQDSRLSDTHFNWNTGYGYNDSGREKVEEIFSKVFNVEDSIVRPTIVNGTHALSLCLQGILRPGDMMLSITSKPYDTLEKVIGIVDDSSSLIAFGIDYKQVELIDTGFDLETIKNIILNTPNIKIVYIQRSKGYSRRRSISIDDIEAAIKIIKKMNSNIIVMVDNCYGEFLEIREPTDVGADIIAGSLIKNPGGGLALSGGYICGRKDLIELVSARLTSPGIGKECGLTFGTNRTLLQGLFQAPLVVANAVKGAIFCAQLFKDFNYEVFPEVNEKRSDIIQSIALNSEKEICDFCEGIQSAAPVDSFVTPVPWEMPGYDSKVIMAAGAFVQGSSIELSADAPIKEPFTVYFQGGLTYEHSKLGAILALNKIIKNL
ncbi:MAG: aminotransferase class I/II-fold pyridoxal phosphate-dependent enzyme [Filifactoraceae bacterium]